MCRDFVDGRVSSADFVEGFLTVYNDPSRAFPNSQAALNLSTWLGVVWEEVDKFDEFPEIRTADEYDDEQLREAVGGWLQQWDAREYNPRTTW
jgi:Bacterial self-protective colicin-like immunity